MYLILCIKGKYVYWPSFPQAYKEHFSSDSFAYVNKKIRMRLLKFSEKKMFIMMGIMFLLLFVCFVFLEKKN